MYLGVRFIKYVVKNNIDGSRNKKYNFYIQITGYRK